MKKLMLLPLLILLPLFALAQSVGMTKRDSSSVSAVEMAARKLKADEGAASVAPAGMPAASPSLSQTERHMTPWKGKSADIFRNRQAEGDTKLPERDYLEPTARQDILLQGQAAQERMLDMPDGVGFRTGGTFLTVGGVMLYGEREREEHPGMLTVQKLNLDATYYSGGFAAIAGATVNRYHAMGIHTQYGLHGSLTYRFSPGVSATLFGEYNNSTPWVLHGNVPLRQHLVLWRLHDADGAQGRCETRGGELLRPFREEMGDAPHRNALHESGEKGGG